MRLPCVRFTVRRMMIAVAVVAVILTVESFLFDFAAEEVRSGDDHYHWGEAMTVWAILNIVLSIPVGLSVAILRAAHLNHAEAKGASDGLYAPFTVAIEDRPCACPG